MRHRWIRAAGLGFALLAGVVLAASPAPAAAQRVDEGRLGSPGALWDQQAQWFDQTTRKALGATQQPETWEVLIDLEKNGEWDHQGSLKEVYRRRLDPAITPDGAPRNTLDFIGTDILIGEVRTAKGSRLYVVAAVLVGDTSLQDAGGRTLKPFVPLHVDQGYPDALRFARAFVRLNRDGIDNGEAATPAPPEALEKGVPCEATCSEQAAAERSACNSFYSSCSSLVYAGWLGCQLTCNLYPPCLAGCQAAALFAQGICVSTRNSCLQAADDHYGSCIDACWGLGGGGGCSVAQQTATKVLSLEGEAPAGQGYKSASVKFSLARAENRGEERFVMDDWVILQNGRAGTTSNSDFARAVMDQWEVPATGSFLMIQEPVHEMNSRYVPKPEVQLSSTDLDSSERGKGEIVAMRLEFSSASIADQVQILYASEPFDGNRLEQLVRRRISLDFASEKEHRTSVYVVFRLTDRFELLGTFTALPKCCCGGVHCM